LQVISGIAPSKPLPVAINEVRFPFVLVGLIRITIPLSSFSFQTFL
jgi:hypothetical protein